MDGDALAGRYEPSPAQRFADAAWRATRDQLTSAEMIVCLAYAKAVKPGADAAWLTQRLLMERCKFASTATVVRVRRSLVRKGWLTPVDVTLMRGGTLTVYRLTVPQPCSLVEPLSDEPGSLVEPLSDEPGSTIEQGWPQPDSLSEPLPPEPDSLSEQGWDRPGSLSEQGGQRPDSLSEPLSAPTRFTQSPDPVHSRLEPGSISEHGTSPRNGPPIGGAQLRASAAARERTHTRGPRDAAAQKAASLADVDASKIQTSSTNGHGPSKEESIAAVRRLLADRGHRERRKP